MGGVKARRDPGRVALYGASGSGKTTKLNQLIRHDERVISFDPAASVAGRAFEDKRAFIKAIMAAKGGPFRLVYRAPRGSDRETELEWLAGFILNFQTGYYRGKSDKMLTFAVDEMSLCYPNKPGRPNSHPFTELCNMGRHYGIRLIGATQRPAEIGATFRGNVSSTYVFRLENDLDVDRVRKIIGLRNADELKTLAPGDCLRFEGGQIFREKRK